MICKVASKSMRKKQQIQGIFSTDDLFSRAVDRFRNTSKSAGGLKNDRKEVIVVLVDLNSSSQSHY